MAVVRHRMVLSVLFMLRHVVVTFVVFMSMVMAFVVMLMFSRSVLRTGNTSRQKSARCDNNCQ